MRNQLRLAATGVVLGLLMAFAACFQTIETSKNLSCEQAADCWDKLPCVNSVCGGEPTPEPAPKPEPTPTDGSEGGTPEQTTQETPQDLSCPVPGGAISFCTTGGSCTSGTCGSFMIPGCTKPSKACTCTKQEDCKSTEKCCTFGNDGVCSPFGCTP